MNSPNFNYLEKEFPLLYNIGCSAEYNLHSDPVTTLWKLRVFEEKIVEYLFEEHSFEKPRENTLHYRIKVLEDEGILQPNIASLIHNIKHKGNIAAHDSKGSLEDAQTNLFSAFKIAKWFYQSYSSEK